LRRTTRTRSERDSTRSPVELAIRRLASRRRFEHDVRSDLRSKGVRGPELEEAVARLKELHLLDDAETSRAWIRDRLRFAPRARGPLRADLLRRGVDAAVADAALDEVYPGPAEREVAARVLRAAAGKLGRLPPAVARRRMWAGLARRGFGRETCREAIADFAQEHDWREDELA